VGTAKYEGHLNAIEILTADRDEWKKRAQAAEAKLAAIAAKLCACGHDHVGAEICWRCECDEYLAVARSFEFKAMKEREATKSKEETPDAYNSSGKPWSEASEFAAKLARAWAARAAASPPPAPASSSSDDEMPDWMRDGYDNTPDRGPQ
jgi:hypothetical protein